MNCSTPGFPVLRHLPELAQIHIHWVSDAIQPSHPRSPPSSSALTLSQHQGLFQWVSSHQVAKVLELQLQNRSFQWIFRVDFHHDWLVWSPCCPRDSQESSPTPQFERINSLALSLLYGPTLTINSHYMTTGKTLALTIWAFAGKVMSLLFNTLSRFVIAFLPRSKHLLISWLQPPSTVIFSSVQLLSSDFRAWENKICHCFHFFPFYLPWSDGTRSIIMALW